MNDLYEQKEKINFESMMMVKKLIHPQVKDYYDVETENKIIAKCKYKCGYGLFSY